jgi:hypothetical protein
MLRVRPGGAFANVHRPADLSLHARLLHVNTCTIRVRMVLTHDKVFQMRASDEFLRQIDQWRREQLDIPSRSEAIRRLIELGLEAAKKGGGSKGRRKAAD